MSNVKFQLSFNKHPKDCPNYSLVNARNVRVSDDFSCLQSEESIFSLQAISITLDTDYRCELIDIIPCNKELVIFAKDKEDSSKASIFRYNEDEDLLVQIYDKLEYGGGRIIGTFTYNVNNELIIAFSEYTEDGAVPLKTINLGVWDGNNTTSDELDFEDGKLALSPEVIIPKVTDFDYIPGTLYKGWYYYFIRYKINNNDYTKWFSIGFPIFITALELKNIFKYGLNNGTRSENPTVISSDYILNGISDHFSSTDDVTDESVSLTINKIDTNYNYFQIGFCCMSKTYSKAFRTADIKSSSSYKYITDISSCISYTVEDLILSNYNYYNVKNIINYKNRLYISNYKETKSPIINENDLNKIRLYIRHFNIGFKDIKYKDLNSNVEYDEDNTENFDFIPANPFLKKNDANVIQISDSNFIYTQSSMIDVNDCYIETVNGTKIYCETIYADNIIYRNSDNIPYYGLCTNVSIWNVTHRFVINGINYSIESQIKHGIYTRSVPHSSDETFDVFSYQIISANSFNNPILTYPQSFIYINTNNSFNKRKKQSTLIPGEIYSFYIHFVNKYGEATQGYKLKNTYKYKIVGSDIYYFPILAYTNNYTKYYLLVPLNNTIYNEDNTLNIDGIVARKLESYNTDIEYDNATNTCIFKTNSEKDIYELINYLGISAQNNTYLNNSILWSDIFITEFGDDFLHFSYFKNSKEDILFRIPEFDCINNASNEFRTDSYTFHYDLNGFTIPDGYVGYYFSYEKFEPTCKFDGLIAKYDTFEQNSISDDYKKYNEESLEFLYNVNFYSSRLDISDNLDLDFDLLQIKFIRQLTNSDNISSYNTDNIGLISKQYPINYNNVELEQSTFKTYHQYYYYSINDFKLNTGGSSIDGGFGVGTRLSIKLTQPQLSKIFNYASFSRAKLIKINKNIYTNENKILIKFTNVYYSADWHEQEYENDTILYGLNGHITYQGTLIYNYNKFIMSAENVILTEQYKSYYRCPVYKGLYYKKLAENRPPIAYIQQLCYNDIFYESKSFKNEPEVLFQNLEEIKADTEEQVMPFAANSIITPANSVDIFQELQTNQDQLNPKTYLANSASRSYVTQFDKRVQRSNVIADESLANSWRTFPLEGYRDISENKGRITNLIGIGTTLLVHTEHSLFAFDGSNTLKTGDDQDIRLTLPDIFDIDYIEVFTSDLGVCGLQDKEACIAGQFGYIFYDNDAHRFYKFSSKKIEFIDFDIVQFLNHNIPYNVRFGYDIERNRLLINFDIRKNIEGEIANLTISYNTQLNKFISLHTYSFNKAVNTKSTLYLIKDNFVYVNALDTNRMRHNIQRRDYSTLPKYYGQFDNGTNISPKISIIANDSYSIIKTIEFLTYKLFKRINNTEDIDTINIANEREISKVPYSGFKLRIHNDLCDSGEIDVSVDNESAKNLLANYDKPWWEFGNWNFNYFRDIKQGTSSHDIMSRIYGNYFIIDIIFYDDENPYPQKIEFEGLDVKLITDETV